MSGKLLLDDDDPMILQVLSRLLAREGYHTTRATTLGEARRALSEETFDLMLLDVLLPGGDGFSFCRQIRTEQRLPTPRSGHRGEMLRVRHRCVTCR
jgi:DNA-binding response OmpR family regulator